jgi:hypothetical protein
MDWRLNLRRNVLGFGEFGVGEHKMVILRQPQHFALECRHGRPN